MPSRKTEYRPPQIRERWRMSVEARALVLVTAALLAFGLAVMYSASAIVAVDTGHDSAYYFVRQLAGIAAGIVVFAVAAKMDAERWSQWAWPLMGTSLVLMLIVVLPFTQSIAPRIHGSRRFLFGASVQPSELAKLAVVVWTAMLVVRKGDALRGLTKGVLPFVVVVGALDILAAVEPDLSTAMLYTLLMAIVLFSGGVRIGHFLLLGVLSIPVLVARGRTSSLCPPAHHLVLRPWPRAHRGGLPTPPVAHRRRIGSPYRRRFWSGATAVWIPSLSVQRLRREQHWGGMGLLGLVMLVLIFAAYGWLGFRIARDARSPFQQLLAIGLTATTLVTAYLHVGVVIGLLPTTGLTLPFISYGRSNLVLSLLMTGILINIGSVRERVVGAHATDPHALAR